MPSQQEPAANSTPLPDCLNCWILRFCPRPAWNTGERQPPAQRVVNIAHLAVGCEQHQCVTVASCSEPHNLVCEVLVFGNSRRPPYRDIQQTFFPIIERRFCAEMAQRSVCCQPQKLFRVVEISGCCQRAGGQNGWLTGIPQGAAE